MLEALMNRTTDAKRAAAADERQELERLIQTARAERAALDETLLVLKARGANLKPIGTFLEHIDEKVTGVTMTLDQIGARLASLDSRTRELEELDQHVQSLRDVARQAEGSVREAIRPNGELQKHREAVEQLTTHVQQTDRKSTRLNSSHVQPSRMPSSA